MTVVGVDGWSRGWVAAAFIDNRIAWSTHPTIVGLVEAYPDATVIAIDMPIGTTDGPREADTGARTWLKAQGGSPSSLFPTPTNATLNAYIDLDGDHSAAMKRLTGTQAGTSIQAWRLIPKILEVKRLGDPRFIEVHPECSFAELDSSAVAHSKKSAKGMAMRYEALTGALELPRLTDAPDRVPVDDLLDATVAAWSAARYATGISRVFPEGASAAPRIVR